MKPIKIGLLSTLMVIGLLLLVVGILIPIYFPSIVEKKLDEKLVLRPDSPTLGNFISPPIPIYMQYYIFNVTNPEEILAGGKAQVKEIGPYTYEENRMKYDLKWNADEDTVIFKQNKTFFFRPDLSNGLLESDELTIINPLYIIFSNKFAKQEGGTMEFMHETIRLRFSLTVFITRKVGELLFHGFKEPMMSEMLYPTTKDPVHLTGRFGLFYPKNNTNDGTYKIKTGGDGLGELTLVKEFRDAPKLDYWTTESCNMINGTEGSQFPRPINENVTLKMFSSDLCRSLYLNFEKTLDRGGLTLYRFVLPRAGLAATPENKCFCTDEFTCRDSMINLSPCKKGVPIITSTPHFYLGNETDVNNIGGLKPIKEHHQTYLDIEPNTGVTFRAHKRIQINVPLRRFRHARGLRNVTEVIFPILWLNESAEVPLPRAEALHVKLTRPLEIATMLSYALIAVGVLIPIVVIIVICIEKRKTGKSKVSKSVKIVF